MGFYVTSGQGLPGSRKARRAGPVPVWHSRVVRRPGFGPGWERFAKMPYGYAGWYRRPGFGPGRERFANPPLPPPLPFPLPVPESPRRRMCQHGFPFPFRPLSDDSRAVPVVERVAQRPSYPSVRTGFLQGQATSPGWVQVSIAPCVPGGVANHSVHTPLLLSPHHLHYASNGGG